MTLESRKHESGLPTTDREMPCIRCGACAEVCPAQLQPQELLRQLRSSDFESAEANGVFDCSECGRCDPVCPSRIPLLQVFLHGKNEIRQRAKRKAVADAARDRYESRRKRLQREAIEAAERQSERKTQVASSDAVAAALERVKAKRAMPNKGPDS
jgi:electron transport complex protein RnfC